MCGVEFFYSFIVYIFFFFKFKVFKLEIVVGVDVLNCFLLMVFRVFCLRCVFVFKVNIYMVMVFRVFYLRCVFVFEVGIYMVSSVCFFFDVLGVLKRVF